MTSLQASHAVSDDTIYTWTDQHALINYGDIPPDEALQSNQVKVLHMQQGTAQPLVLPARALDARFLEPQGEARNEPGTATSRAPAAVPAGALPQAGGGVNAPNSTAPRMVSPSTAPRIESKNPSSLVAKSDAPVIIASGQAHPLDDGLADKKIAEQEARLEQDAKTARRVAMEKRRQEMQLLAERVRNGAASRQEIAALMTYRQTASLTEARSAMARTKPAPTKKTDNAN